MEIKLQEIPVRDLAQGYEDNAENGVVGYGGKLDIRPPFQREFIYKEAQRNAVIDTVRKGFPLNVMYWATRDDGTFEIIDGQQRTISICQYVQGDFSVPIDGLPLAFHNLQDDQQKKILDYPLMVYICTGSKSEKLDWFKTINIAGEKLTDQELRNAVYHGSWVSDAKRYFSRTGCAAYGLGGDYLTGSANRQDYLETAIRWISGGRDQIDSYMSTHQHDPNANELWLYFQNVINWVTTTIQPAKERKKIMKGVEWGPLYDAYKNEKFDAKKIEAEAARLNLDNDVTKKTGIYPYIFTREEKHLSIRTFKDAEKLSAYERQKGICAHCKKHFDSNEMEADHITPWHAGGHTTPENCQMLCRPCNRRKSGR